MDDLAIADLLQTLVRTGKDAVVTIQHDGQVSRVWCEAGHIIDAESPSRSGADAFGHILSIEHGHVTAEFQRANRPVTIRMPLDALIVEHVRLLEETKAQRPEPPSASIESSVNKITGSESWADARSSAAADDASTRSGGVHASKTELLRHRSTMLVGFEPRDTRKNTERVPFAEEEITARHQEMSALVQRPAHHVSAPVEPKRRRGLRLMLLAPALLLVALAIWAALAARESPAARTTAAATAPRETSSAPSADPSKTSLELDVSADPASAEFRLDGAKIAVGHALRNLPADGREHVLEVSAEGHVSQTFRFTNTPPRGRITLVPRPATRASEQPWPVAHEPRMPANVASSIAQSRRPSKTVRSHPLDEDTKSNTPGRIEIVPTPRDPHIRVIEGNDPKIKMLE